MFTVHMQLQLITPYLVGHEYEIIFCACTASSFQHIMWHLSIFLPPTPPLKMWKKSILDQSETDIEHD